MHKKYLCQSLFLSCNFIKKETLAHGFSCEFCKIFKNTFFTEHLWITASILQQLLALYYAIMYSWQFSSNEESLVGRISSSIYLNDFTDLDFFFSFFFFSLFFIFPDKCLLRKAYAVL